jgi:hypothetical protein
MALDQALILLLTLIYVIPWGTATNYHKLDGLKQIILSQFWSPKILNQAVRSTVLSLSASGDNPSPSLW